MFVTVIENLVLAVFLKLLIFGVGQVADFEFQFSFFAAKRKAFTRNEIKLNARLFLDIRLTRCTTAGNPVGRIAEQDGLLLQTLGIFETELQIDQMISLAGQWRAVGEEVERVGGRCVKHRNLIARLHTDL